MGRLKPVLKVSRRRSYGRRMRFGWLFLPSTWLANARRFPSDGMARPAVPPSQGRLSGRSGDPPVPAAVGMRGVGVRFGPPAAGAPDLPLPPTPLEAAAEAGPEGAHADGFDAYRQAMMQAAMAAGREGRPLH